MFKIEGLDKLTKQMNDAEKAIAAIDVDLGSVNFNPHDPESIERAIVEAENMVDSQIQDHADNPFVAKLAEQMKARFRDGIVAQAADARAGGADSE